MVRSLFGNSNRKLRSTFWGSPFIPVGTNQTECCLPLTNFSVPSRFQTHATQIRPFLDSNRNGCGISTVNWQIAYHYAFATPTGFFCQMVSTPGEYTSFYGLFLVSVWTDRGNIFRVDCRSMFSTSTKRTPPEGRPFFFCCASRNYGNFTWTRLSRWTNKDSSSLC